jgi:DtxR family transcriptional regulator, Mn-dependent transcriptional regulator
MKETSGKYDNGNTKSVTSTMEDYLKVIFDLAKTKRVVRVKDIAKKLDVKMPTVTSMLEKLDKRGLVKHRKYEYVELEDMGVHFAKETYRRHRILLRFLEDILTVEKKTAAKEACKMEHLISQETLGSLSDFMNFVDSCPRVYESWPARFKTYRENGCRLGICEGSKNA